MNIKKETYLNFEGLLIPIDKICGVNIESEKSKFVKNGYNYRLYIMYMFSNNRILIFETTDKKEIDDAENKINELLFKKSIK